MTEVKSLKEDLVQLRRCLVSNDLHGEYLRRKIAKLEARLFAALPCHGGMTALDDAYGRTRPGHLING